MLSFNRFLLRLSVTCGVSAFAILAQSTTSSAGDAVEQNDLLNATLWMQQSVEYKANVLGAYALARIRLDQALADKNWTALPGLQPKNYADLPPAIILDCDETVLDNNLYEAHLVKDKAGFTPQEWTAYVNEQVTGAIPGAVEFTQYAASKGIKVFFITNRTKEEEPATAKNMEKLGFPLGNLGSPTGGNVDTLLTKGEQPDWKSAKGSRDKVVAVNYRVLLMLGDNFADFTDDFKGSPEDRLKVFNANLAHWGKDWIALPNPEYGSFESAPFKSDYKLSDDEQRKLKIESLVGWQPRM
jgi:acid phosphatase